MWRKGLDGTRVEAGIPVRRLLYKAAREGGRLA